MTRFFVLIAALSASALLSWAPASFAYGLSSGGDVPIPAKLVNGAMQSTWDGSYSDLLAADALAMCWTTQQDSGSNGAIPETDGIIISLMARMAMSSCRTTCSNPAYTVSQDLQICAYLDSRKDASCNVSPTTSKNQALDVSAMRSPSQTQYYTLPSDSALGIASTATPLRASGQRLLAYTDLTLCMAEQLREKLDTVQVAFASGDDLARVQELVRGFSLAAVYQYSALGKLFALNEAPPAITAGLRADTRWGLVPVSLWYRNFFSAAMAKRWGDDFAEAIKMLVDSTERSIELKMRDPQAQSSFGTPGFVANHSKATAVSQPGTGGWPSGLVGPREAILEEILYDGFDDTGSSGRPRGVQSDMSDPKIGVLLGLARRAGALKLVVDSTGQLNRGASAHTMFFAVDNYSLSMDCANQGVPPASCPTTPPWVPSSYYSIVQRHGLSINHAQALVDALSEGLFGLPSRPPAPAGHDGLFEYRPDAYNSDWRNVPPAAQLSMHFFGAHQFTGTRIPLSYGEVVIDPNFTVEPPSATDIQSMRGTTNIPVRNVRPSMDALSQIGSIRDNPMVWRDATGYPVSRRSVGSNTVLALARETLLQLSAGAAPATGIFTQAAPALGLIEKAIGTRQVILRQFMQPSVAQEVCPGCALSYRYYINSMDKSYFIIVDEITKATDPLDRIAVAPGVPLAATLVRDPNTVTLFGGTQANSIANLTYATPTVTSFPAAGAYSDYVIRTTSNTWQVSAPAGVSVILKSSTTPVDYRHVYTGRFGVYPYQFPFALSHQGTVVTFGGRFERLVNKAWTFDPARWSLPKYDGFGLPRDWVPSTDASLFGGQPGTSVESHFLARASTAAEESTNALHQAFDNLQQQSIDTAAAQSNDARAQQLTALEYQSLCGATGASCKPSYTYVPLYVPGCTPSVERCEVFRTELADIVGGAVDGGVPLAAPVVSAMFSGDPAPTFPDYKGGVLQSLLLDERNAFFALATAMNTAVLGVTAAIGQVDVAQADLNAANAEKAVVDLQILEAYAQIAATDATIAAQQIEYTTNKELYATTVAGARTSMDQECSHDALVRARKAGFNYSWGGPGQVRVDNIHDDGGWKVEFQNSTWSPSAWYAQKDRCQAATNAWLTATNQAAHQTKIMEALLVPLSAQTVFTGTQTAVLPARKTAATTHVEAATVRVATANLGVGAQAAIGAQAVQAANGQLLQSIVAIDQAYAEADMAAARIAIEKNQVDMDIRTRFGVRARFNSYDLWRARALTENARRLAVAARRSIEARYVVDLSAMKAVEPFVEAPSVWADQIYSSDLKPFSIGLTQATAVGSGLNASAVKDYVNNLKLFLDGFAIERPSGAVLSDAEVIQLPAPAPQVLATAHDTPVAYIDPTSSGWSFLCASNGKWISNPDIGKFVVGAPTWTLAKACAGAPPTLARLVFSLDPWGRTQGSTQNPPYAARYNVRTRAIALNLVGSGIRSCQRTTDPSTCYAEPFIRYDLKHIGPAWVTSYDQTWHSLSIPVAVIEAGKALATEEWLDPVSNGFNRSDVSNVARTEFIDRPIGGAYELTLRLTPDVNLEYIERIQMLTQTSYWVKQQ